MCPQTLSIVSTWPNEGCTVSSPTRPLILTQAILELMLLLSLLLLLSVVGTFFPPTQILKTSRPQRTPRALHTVPAGQPGGLVLPGASGAKAVHNAVQLTGMRLKVPL